MDFSKLITGVKVESAWGPDINIADPFGPGEPSPLLKALRPRLTIETTAGPVVVAPYGAPGVSKWPWVKVAAVVLVGVGIVGVARALRR